MEPSSKKYSYNRRFNRRHQQKRSHTESHGGEEGWLISYADMMTLLFGFFVILYSMSKVDKKKYEEMSQSMAKQFQEKVQAKPLPPPPAPATQFSKVLKEQLLKAGLGTKDVEIVDDGKSLTISLRGRTSFESGKTKLLPEGEAFVKEVASYLKDSKLPFEVRVEGHTDDAAINSAVFPTNWELSAARAAGVASRMTDFGIAPDKLVASGFGSSRPLKENRKADGTPILENMSLNRRVMIVVAFPEPETPKVTVKPGAGPTASAVPVAAPATPRLPAAASAVVTPQSPAASATPASAPSTLTR